MKRIKRILKRNGRWGLEFFFIIAFSFSLKTDAKADTYNLVNTRFIPWGYQNSQIPSPGNGPGFFHFDDNGDLFIYCYDNKQHTLIKFNSQGVETGRIVLDFPAERVKVMPDKIFMIYSVPNEVVYVDKNLTSIKKIKIPKEYKAWGLKFYNGVLYRNEFDKSTGGRNYVFDEDEYEKAGKPEKSKNLNLRFDYVVQYAPPTQKLFLKKPDGYQIKVWEAGESQPNDILRISDEKNPDVFFNISFPSLSDANAIGDSTLLKVSPEGKILATLQFHPDDVVETYCGSRVIPLDVDKVGNIYRMRTNKDGVLIDKWSDQ
jgi:hypothetical protein